jgi:hypothetical protein
MWQKIFLDVSLMVGGFLFFLALVPTIKAKEKPALSTSVITALVLYEYCIAYILNGLWLALVSGLLTAVAWSILFVQGKHRNTP